MAVRNGPNPFTVCTVQSKVTETLKEVTLWLRQRAIAKLLTDIGKIDTALGHAVRASSWATTIIQGAAVEHRHRPRVPARSHRLSRPLRARHGCG